MTMMRAKWTWQLVAAFMMLAAFLTLAGCSDDDAPREIDVGIEVLGQDPPVTAEASPIEETDTGFQHQVRVTWRGTETVRLDDARFAHQVESGDGSLITVGRGCGANWDEQAEAVLLACTADLQLIFLEPGGAHSYPIAIVREVGPHKLTPGTYVIEENIHWWQQADINAEPTEEGEFTIRLTYEVR